MKKINRKICFLLIYFLFFQPFFVLAESPSPSPSPSPPFITKHVYANGEVVATIREQGTATSTYIIHNDHLGSSSILTDKDAKVAEGLDYYPYGEIRLNQKFSSIDEQRKFTGHELDNQTSLTYMGARYYPGKVGRFVSQDEVFLAMGNNSEIQGIAGLTQEQILTNPQILNSYSYAANNPLIYVDKDGQIP